MQRRHYHYALSQRADTCPTVLYPRRLLADLLASGQTRKRKRIRKLHSEHRRPHAPGQPRRGRVFVSPIAASLVALKWKIQRPVLASPSACGRPIANVVVLIPSAVLRIKHLAIGPGHTADASHAAAIRACRFALTLAHQICRTMTALTLSPTHVAALWSRLPFLSLSSWAVADSRRPRPPTVFVPTSTLGTIFAQPWLQ